MYWHVHDILDARTMTRIVMDVAWNEGALRRRLIMPKQLDRSVVSRIGRVKDGHCVRAIYLKRYMVNRVYLKLSNCIICLWSVHM